MKLIPKKILDFHLTFCWRPLSSEYWLIDSRWDEGGRALLEFFGPQIELSYRLKASMPFIGPKKLLISTFPINGSARIKNITPGAV